MTTAELLKTLARECPNGVSFEPMAVRLLRQRVRFEDYHLNDLKAKMFQMGNGLWFSHEMISDNQTRLALLKQAMEWLRENGCFSVERLFECFYGVLRHISKPEDFAAYLRHLKFSVTAWTKCGFLCFKPPTTLGVRLAATSNTILKRLDEAGGTLALNEIEDAVPHLTTEALGGIRAQFLPEVHEVEVGGIPCWRSTEAIGLPEDFAEKLTNAVDTLNALGEKVSVAKLEFALNLSYRIRFREQYAIPDNATFMRLCAEHYQGGNGVFQNVKKLRVGANNLSVQVRRIRNPNTRFRALGVPIGTELVFTKDSHITCTVLDDANQVEYEGKAWTISALANHLLEVSYANGFYHFRCEGETLWERRQRLEREGKQDEYQAKESSLQANDVRSAEGEIIGLEGKPLSPRTWRAIKSAGANPRVAEWAQRVENGKSVENVASEIGLAVSTVKEYIRYRRRYLVTCDKNGIVPEGGANV